MTRGQHSQLNRDMAELNREFKRRLEQIERDHVQRLMATFQEFKALAFTIRNGRPMEDGNKISPGRTLEVAGAVKGTNLDRWDRPPLREGANKI